VKSKAVMMEEGQSDNEEEEAEFNTSDGEDAHAKDDDQDGEAELPKERMSSEASGSLDANKEELDSSLSPDGVDKSPKLSGKKPIRNPKKQDSMKTQTRKIFGFVHRHFSCQGSPYLC